MYVELVAKYKTFGDILQSYIPIKFIKSKDKSFDVFATFKIPAEDLIKMTNKYTGDCFKLIFTRAWKPKVEK